MAMKQVKKQRNKFDMLYKEAMKKKWILFCIRITVIFFPLTKKEKLISVDFHLGMKFRCSVLIAPVKNESCDIILYILEFTESTDRNQQRRMSMS
jgi:hypothetical protein